MKYFQTDFLLKPYEEAFADVLSALLADLGYETFSPHTEGLTAYIQRPMYDEDAVRSLCTCFPLPGVNITFCTTEAPDENWNQVWEEEGFHPVCIDQRIVVHDVKHTDVPEVEYDILITPRMAFGTGSHQTTRMLLSTLADMPIEGCRVVDAGTGTGVLAIMCMKRGAAQVLAYDIDEWSVENAKDNVLLNGFSASIDIRQGDASVLENIRGVDLLIANINRNILLADMPSFYRALRPGGKLLLSGFYAEDIPALENAASSMGMKKICANQGEDGWSTLLLETDTTSRMDI